MSSNVVLSYVPDFVISTSDPLFLDFVQIQVHAYTPLARHL